MLDDFFGLESVLKWMVKGRVYAGGWAGASTSGLRMQWVWSTSRWVQSVELQIIGCDRSAVGCFRCT